MGRLRGVVLAGCLLLAACGGGSGGAVTGTRDYIDFIRLGGVTYYVADHGVGRPITAGAHTGADLLDLDGKVRYLSVNSGRYELARIKDRPRVAELVGQVLAAPVRPTSGRIEQRHCFVVFNLADRTAVRRLFVPGTGELWPGVVVPPPFTEAIEGALAAEGQTCGRAA